MQVGIRGSIYEASEHDLSLAQGGRIIYMEEFVRCGVADVMDEARAIARTGPTCQFRHRLHRPLAGAGTRTPETGGFAAREAQEMVRLFQGVDIVGADAVEVALPSISPE